MVQLTRPDQLPGCYCSVACLLLTLLTWGRAAVWWVRGTCFEVDSAQKLDGDLVGVWLVCTGSMLLLRWRSRLVSVRFAWVCLVMFSLALLSLGLVNSSRHHEVILTPER